MYGTDSGSIKVLTSEIPSDVPMRQWSEYTQPKDQWRQAFFGYSSSDNAQYVQFVFQGQVGNGFSSDLALDDIFIESGSCAGVTPTRPFTTSRPITNPNPAANFSSSKFFLALKVFFG